MAKIHSYLLFTLMSTAFMGFSAIEETEWGASKKTLPIGAEVYLSQNLGAGTAFKAYQQEPYLASNLVALPYYKYGPFFGEQEIKVHAELHTFFEWMSQNNPFPGKLSKKMNMGDIKVRAEWKNILLSKDLGISLSPALKIEVPLSKSSRDANRIVGLGGFLTAAWSKWGWFFNYKPVVLGYAHSVPYKSGDCIAGSNDEHRLSNGKCKVAGDQTMVLLKNILSAGYTNGSHTVSLGFHIFHHFLREKGKNVAEPQSTNSGVMIGSLGVVEYSYLFPLSIPTTLIAGLAGEQGLYDATSRFRMPFFDFTEPAKNVTEAYVAVSVSI